MSWMAGCGRGGLHVKRPPEEVVVFPWQTDCWRALACHAWHGALHSDSRRGGHLSECHLVDAACRQGHQGDQGAL